MGLRRRMVRIQPIEHAGRVVALVLGGRALIDNAQLPADALPIVQAKCLYALEIQGQTRPGPYTELAATRFAEDVMAQVVAHWPGRPPVIRLPARRACRVKA